MLFKWFIHNCLFWFCSLVFFFLSISDLNRNVFIKHYCEVITNTVRVNRIVETLCRRAVTLPIHRTPYWSVPVVRQVWNDVGCVNHVQCSIIPWHGTVLIVNVSVLWLPFTRIHYKKDAYVPILKLLQIKIIIISIITPDANQNQFQAPFRAINWVHWMLWISHHHQHHHKQQQQ